MNRKILFTFLILCLATYAGKTQNIIKNPNFEAGTPPTGPDQVANATFWDKGCADVYVVSGGGGTMLGSPDLFQAGSASCTYSAPLNKWSPNRSSHNSGNRYVGIAGGWSTIAADGKAHYNESVRGELITPLSACTYKISAWASAVNGHNYCISPEPLTPHSQNRIEAVLRIAGDCSTQKIIQLSGVSTPFVTTIGWVQYSATVTLTAAEAAMYNAIEFRLALADLNAPYGTREIFIDDVYMGYNTTPTFPTIPTTLCQGYTPPTLPATDLNGITGIWSPSSVSTATPGTFTFTFTPNPGQCASQTTQTITITQNITPTFSTVGPYCSGATILALPTTSTNGITGTWSPAINNTATTTYTFTPTIGQCANTTTLTITINPLVTPTFLLTNTYCKGTTPQVLPLVSNNNISGTWSPSVISTATVGTTNYVFTPSSGQSQCITNFTLTVVVNPTPTANINVPIPICAGYPLQLSTINTPGYSYNWSGPTFWSATGSTPPAINPAVAGTYYLTVTNNYSCSSTTSTTVSFNKPPKITLTSNTPCENTALNLFASSGISYNWSGPGGWSSNVQNPIVNPAISGNYYVTVTTSIASCPSTGQISIAVNPAPVATATSNAPICNFSDLRLYANGGNNYSWSGPHGFSSNLQNPVIPNATNITNPPDGTTNNAGIYSVIVTSNLGCTSTAYIPAAIFTEIIGPQDIISTTPSPACEGQQISLTENYLVTSGLGWYWSWYGPNNFVSTSNNPTFTATNNSSGWYYVSLYNPTYQWCIKATGKFLQVYDTPTAYYVTGNTCCMGSGAHVYLYNSENTAMYQLYINGTPIGTPVIGGGQIDFGIQTTPGVYTVIGTTIGSSCIQNMLGSATLSNNCCKMADEQIYITNKQSEIKIYPNPNNGSFIIESNNEGIYKLFDISGASIRNIEINNKNSKHVIIEGLAAGIYFLKNISAGSSELHKIIVTE